ncbi:MAG TPA: Fe-S cluster assembly protein SufD [Gammaproteobacteria bacterium]|nr:Fe-S cluster assembly protein SufD [Gammaproteobacteria bacterium]
MRAAAAELAVPVPRLPDWIESAAAAATGPDWLTALRREGLLHFATAGFPTRRDEDWKYTDLKLVARRSFAASANATLVVPEIEGLEGPVLVFINGRLAESRNLPAGVSAATLSSAFAADDPACRELLGRIADPARHRFAALSTALFGDGVLLDLPDDTALAEPIRLVFLAGGDAGPVLACPRVLVRAGARSQATLIEHYGAGSGESLSLAVTELALGPGAHLEHYRLQAESGDAFHLGVLAARLQPDAALVSHNLSVGGRIARLDLDVECAGSGARVEMNGLYLARGRQHVDSHTRVDHAVPHTTSDQLYRGVLAGRSRAVFNGKAIVHPGAAGTDARQANANLLLSPEAEVDTKPELEIYADDVKCAHGATTGQLDDTALFYLRSRGIDEHTAKSLLTFAFADTVLTRMSLAPLRRHAEQLVVGRLPDADLIREFT